MLQKLFTIQSEGDLEVMVLLESHSLLAEIISKNFYRLSGRTPRFYSRITLDYFYVRASELSVQHDAVQGQLGQVSLLDGLMRVCKNNKTEAPVIALEKTLKALQLWLYRKEKLPLAPHDKVNRHIKLALSRQQMILLVANANKHHLLRLSTQLGRIRDWCKKEGVICDPKELLNIHNDLVENIRLGLQYYATWYLRLLGRVFFALNRLVVARWLANPTNIVPDMVFPAGISSDVFRNFYGALMVFHRYDDDRILRYIPKADWHQKLSYWSDRKTRAALRRE